MRRRMVYSIEAGELLAIDRRIAALGRGLGAMRLRVGEGLLRLEVAGGVKALGFPNLESYCREGLGRSGRWGSDVRCAMRSTRSSWSRGPRVWGSSAWGRPTRP